MKLTDFAKGISTQVPSEFTCHWDLRIAPIPSGSEISKLRRLAGLLIPRLALVGLRLCSEA